MTKNSERTDARLLTNELVEIARADTQYADLYLDRARELLSAELSPAQFAALDGLEGEIAELTNRIEAAIADRDWTVVGELTRKVTDLKHAAAEQGPTRSLAARVYESDDVLVDPFSPGISAIAGVAERDLPSFRDAAVKRLQHLSAADPANAELYGARLDALRALRFDSASVEDATVTVEGLQARAHTALVRGDLAQVQQLSAKLLELERTETRAGPATAAFGGRSPPRLVNPFPPEVVERARRFGLAPQRVESMAEEVFAKFRPSWQVVHGDPSGNTLRLTMTVPGDTDQALRDGLELLMKRAFVTSAGTRYIPWMTEEDVLVDEVGDPAPGAEPPATPLLAALELTGRRAVARKTLERALRMRGSTVVTELGLDPREYRIVCLPPDVYTRLGRKLGWGKQEIWTHLDGYLASPQRKLMALAGGDARFGGLHDLVAVGADYDSERLFIRLAVVQRRRFATW